LVLSGSSISGKPERKNQKSVSFYAKKGCGVIVRFILQSWLKGAAELRDFNAGGYNYKPDLSNVDNLVFMRDAAA